MQYRLSGEKLMVEITIDGQNVEVEKGTKILEAANKLGIDIPTLCYHAGLPPDGNCRLCQVEIETETQGKKKLAFACMYPVREGMKVFTGTERVLEARRSVIKLHLNRTPQVKILQDLAEEYGVELPDASFVKEHDDLCIRCGRCVRACKALGNNCLGFTGRGWDRELVLPTGKSLAACRGCAACAEVCPAGAIVVKEDGDVREIWGRRFRLVRCTRCGDAFATEEQMAVVDTSGTEGMNLCPRCRTSDEAERIKNI